MSSRRLILAIEAFIGLGALLPGWLLLQDPSGAHVGLRAEWLAGSPFNDYQVPGAFLFGVIGLGNLALIGLSLRKPAWAGPGALAMGGFLMAWIVCQWLWLQPRSGLQPFVFALGAALVLLGYLVRTRRSSDGGER